MQSTGGKEKEKKKTQVLYLREYYYLTSFFSYLVNLLIIWIIV